MLQGSDTTDSCALFKLARCPAELRKPSRWPFRPGETISSQEPGCLGARRFVNVEAGLFWEG